MGSGTLASGVGDVIFPTTITIPGAANPIDVGTAATIAAGADLKFIVTSATQLCANFGAKITKPLTMTLLPANANPCIFRLPVRATGGAPADADG